MQANNGSGRRSPNLFEQTAVWQQLWFSACSKIAQAAFSGEQHPPPQDLARQLRGRALRTMAQAWDEFMRSPQFLENMRQWVASVADWRQSANNALARARHELQGTAREDIDALILAMRHMERRILDRQDDLEAQITELQRQVAALQQGTSRGKGARRGERPRSSRSLSGKRASRTSQAATATTT